MNDALANLSEAQSNIAALIQEKTSLEQRHKEEINKLKNEYEGKLKDLKANNLKAMDEERRKLEDEYSLKSKQQAVEFEKKMADLTKEHALEVFNFI